MSIDINFISYLKASKGIATRGLAAWGGLFVFSALLSASITTTTTLSVIPSASEFGQKVSLIATVSPAPAPGFVSFVMNGGILVGSAAVNSSGIAEATSITLPAGSNSLVAVYGGNTSGGYLASQSAALPYTVTAVPGFGFKYPVNYGVGSYRAYPSVAVVADFNGDGIADLAGTYNYSNSNASGGVIVLLGNGNGTFQTAVKYGAGSEPSSMAVGDFNGDGKADLAVANIDSNNVSVLLGKGNGTFQAAVNYGAGSLPYSVAVADFNGDGNADLVVANYYGDPSSGVSVLLGNGDGTFHTAVNYGAGSFPSSVAVADFNGDGKADVVVANQVYDGSVSVLLGNGDGTFQTVVSFGVGEDPYSVAVGDFNGDGKADLAVPSSSNAYVSVLLGNGNGTFQAAVNSFVGGEPRSVAVGDFNGDGKADLVVANGGMSVLLGNGDGTFQTAVNYLAGDADGLEVVGDFNGDGRADLAAGNGDSGVSVLLALTAMPSSMTANPGTTPQSAVIDTAFRNALAVTIRDAGGNPIEGVVVTFAAPNPDTCGYYGEHCIVTRPSAYTSGYLSTTVATDSSGVASAPFTADVIAGAYTVSATSNGLPAVNFSLTNCGLVGLSQCLQ